MICHAQLRRCTVPGPVLADVAFSDVIALSSPDDDWTPWQCFDFPKVNTPPGYKRWNYVDSPTHKNNGEDVPGIRIAYSDDETKVCVSIRGAENPPPWKFREGKRPTELSFRLNAVSYNSSLMLAKTRIPPRSSDCPDSFSGINNPNSQPCMTAGESWHPMSIPEGFTGIGLVEPVLYEDRGSYASFVSIVIGVSELKPIIGEWRGYNIDRYMLFATAMNYLCGGYVGLRYHGVFWRDGLDVRARILTSTVSETTPEGGATHDWEPPGDGVTTYLTFLNLRSLNLNAEVIKEDMFWKYCGSMNDGHVTCSQKKPAENPLPDPLEDGLTKAADAGAVKLCKSFLPVGELCDAAGKEAGWLAEKLLNLLFIHGECTDDAGKDKDLEFLMSKSVDEHGSNFHFEARSGDGRLHPGPDRDDPYATISAQVVQLGFKE